MKSNNDFSSITNRPKIVRTRGFSRLPNLLALLGALLFGLQLFAYAPVQTTFVDEGMYLYLGYRFVSGSLSYADLGAWNYYAPLSYFLPGVAQFIFGPNLETGRFFSMACALLAALALWTLARRLRGEWWAAAATWALALTPQQIKMYTLGLSQALTACLLAWTLVLTIGEIRSPGQILGGALLAGLTVMTRHNLVLLLPALVGYVFWQHGRRMAWLALVSSLMPLLIGMAFFWPSSLRLWVVYWLSPSWLPLLSQYGPPSNTQPIWHTTFSPLASVSSLFMALRTHFLALAGATATLLLWPMHWTSRWQQRTAIFLATFFFGSFLLHASILFSRHPDIFAFTSYLAFFSIAGLVLTLLTLPIWERRPNRPRSLSIVVFILFLALAPAYIDKMGDRLLALPVPRINNGIRLGEWSFLGSYLAHWFHLDYTVMRQILPPIFFLLAGLLWLTLLASIYLWLKRRFRWFSWGFAPFALLATLASGFLLSPTLLNAPYRQDQECGQNMFAYYRQLGTALAKAISSGNLLYWQAQSATPLLYAPKIEIHPTQVYSIYTYRIGGNPAQVKAAGYWNAEIAMQWAKEADILVLEGEESYTPINLKWADEQGYVLMAILPPLNPCSYAPRPLFLFRRNP